MSSTIASLGMYDHPAQRAANDAVWAAVSARLRARGIDAPDQLDRSRPVDAIWRDPDLLFAQTCGFPLVTDRTLALQVVAIPIYTAPDCAGGRHVSYVIARSAEGNAPLGAFRNRRAAINARTSNSGYNLFRATIAPLAGGEPFFGGVVETGSHRASVEAVRTGAADIAAIDAISFAVFHRYEPASVAGLRIVAITPESPTLPFVTARATAPETVAALREALFATLADPALEAARDALFLTNAVPGDLDRYAAIREIEAGAVAAGYPDLR